MYRASELDPFGVILYAEENSLSISEIPIESLKTLFHEHQLLVLRGFANFETSKELSNYCRAWGSLSEWPFGTVLELIQQDKAKDHIFDNSHVPLHWDGMYRPTVPEIQIFQCVKAPQKKSGGRTTFVHTSKALENATREKELLLRTATGRYRRKMEYYDSVTSSPVVISHPYKDYEVIRYNEWCGPKEAKIINPVDVTIENIKNLEREHFHAGIKELLFDPRNFYAHEWSDGDIVISDNFTLLHGRESFDSRAPRHVRRVQVESDPPFVNPGLESYR